MLWRSDAENGGERHGDGRQQEAEIGDRVLAYEKWRRGDQGIEPPAAAGRRRGEARAQSSERPAQARRAGRPSSARAADSRCRVVSKMPARPSSGPWNWKNTSC
jgi:hypothetical protein